MTKEELKPILKERAKECLQDFAQGIEKIASARDSMDFIVEQLGWDDMSKFDYEEAMTKLVKCLADLVQWEKFIDESFEEINKKAVTTK